MVSGQKSWRGCQVQATEVSMALKKSLILFLVLVLMILVLGCFETSLCQETRAMRFQRQHMDSNNFPNGNATYCNVMMVCRNMTWGRCKEINTFVHEPLSAVEAICSEKNRTCSKGTKNCYQSRYPMSITVCRLRRGSRHPNCTYTTSPVIQQHITVACAGVPYVPVHFES